MWFLIIFSSFLLRRMPGRPKRRIRRAHRGFNYIYLYIHVVCTCILCRRNESNTQSVEKFNEPIGTTTRRNLNKTDGFRELGVCEKKNRIHLRSAEWRGQKRIFIEESFWNHHRKTRPYWVHMNITNSSLSIVHREPLPLGRLLPLFG